MRIEPASVVVAVVIGIGATLLMDAWNLLLKRAFGIGSLDYCMLGRWVLHMPAALRHANIAAAARRHHECPVGWTAHYSIGVSLALVFVLLQSGDGLTRPTLSPALLFGLVTVVFPFFVLQPALGLGIASAKAARPLQARVKSMGTHLVFGLGLYLGALGYASVHSWPGLLPR